jgi:hypothetical protein
MSVVHSGQVPGTVPGPRLFRTVCPLAQPYARVRDFPAGCLFEQCLGDSPRNKCVTEVERDERDG